MTSTSLSTLTVARHPEYRAPSSDATQMFADAFVAAGVRDRRTWRGGRFWSPLLRDRSRPGRRGSTNNVTVAPMMGPRRSFLLPHLWIDRLYLYIYDVWEINEEEWRGFVRLTGPIGITANGTAPAEFFRQSFPNIPVAVALEAVDPSWVRLKPELSASRPIDVLQVGRIHRRFHDTITTDKRRASFAYLYPNDGARLFATKGAYQKALANTKIAICVPRSSSHPEQAGRYPVMTQRYWEAMAAGALLLGESIPDLTQAAGYDPVIAIDQEAAMDQVLDLLGNFSSWRELRAENLRTVERIGSYDRLVSEIVSQVHVVSQRGSA